MSNKKTTTQTIKQFKKAFEEAYGIKPNEVKAQNTLRVDYYKSFLWRLFLGSVRVRVPLSWSIDYFRAVLFWGGGIGATEYGATVVPFAYSIKERNAWHYPVSVQPTGEVNQVLPLDLKVGEDCEIIYLDSAEFPNLCYASGVASLIEIYAEKLANCDGAIDVNLFNTRTPFVFGCETEKDVQDMKQFVNRLTSGAPAIYYKITRKQNPSQKELPILKIPAKENFIALDTQAAKRAIIDEFLTAIGINNANTDKRERLIQSEVEANDAEIQSAVALWQDNVNRTIEKVKKRYPDFFAEDGNELSVKFIGAERGKNELSRTNGNMAAKDGAAE